MTIRNIKQRLAVILIMLIVCFGTVMGGQGNLSAFAATDVKTAYENTNVWDNLQGATIGGETFDISDYPHNSNGKPQIISLVEFCYSYYADKQQDFGLYIYVYNPQDIAFDVNTERNKIEMTYGNKASYSKYVLEFLNYSNKEGYEGRFYKFRIKLSAEEKRNLFNIVEENKRVYKIAGIELSYKGTVKDYADIQNYTYSGYAKGYGSELATSDTLTCQVDGFGKYLSLDVRSTYFRPEGSNGSRNKQDTLHSVYFAVPNEIIREYGVMTAVHATWLNAYTAPIFVTGNADLYDGFMGIVGQEDPDTDYAFHTNERGTYLGGFYFVNYSHGYNYTSNVENVITKLNYCFFADNKDADNYTLPAEKLIGDDDNKGWFETYTANFGGPLVNDKYSAALFESVDAEFTDTTITEDDTFKLTSVTSSQSLWQRFWGTKTEYTNTYTMSAIQAVTLDDMDNALSEKEFCNEFFVAETDYDELYDYVKIAKIKDETVYLFRYYQSEYFAVELSEGKYETGFYTVMVGDHSQLAYGRHYKQNDTNAFLCQMWVQLDFDIIDLTFTKDGVDTVIPVIMDPIDLAADGTPPLETTKDGLKWWQILLGIIALVVIILLLVKFAPVIVLVTGKAISLPFKAIGAASKAAKQRRRERKEKKRAEKQAERQLKQQKGGEDEQV